MHYTESHIVGTAIRHSMDLPESANVDCISAGAIEQSYHALVTVYPAFTGYCVPAPIVRSIVIYADGRVICHRTGEVWHNGER